MSGDCCRLFYINLNESEYHSKRYETMLQAHGHIDDFELAESAGATILAKKPDGSCVYLSHNLCSIHDWKPAVCRPFTCDSVDAAFSGMVDQVRAFRDQKAAHS